MADVWLSLARALKKGVKRNLVWSYGLQILCNDRPAILIDRSEKFGMPLNFCSDEYC